MITLNPVRVSREDKMAVMDVLNSDHLSKGPYVEKLKERVKESYPNSKVFPVANASLGIQAVLESLRIGPGDEVITSPLTFISAISAIHRVGATPVYCDVRYDYTINPFDIPNHITNKTVAIIATDLYGNPADGMVIRNIARTRGLAFIQDCAQSYGAERDFRPTGSYADYAVFSFYATKNFTGGEGGIIISNKNDDWSNEKLELITNCGFIPDLNIFGTNMRMDEMSAALIWSQIEPGRVECVLSDRGINANIYDEILGVDRKVGETFGTFPSFHLYPVVYVDYELGGNPVKFFANHGVQIGSYYKNTVCDSENTPNAAFVAHCGFTLPVHEELTEDEVEYIAHLWKDNYGSEY